MRLEQQRAKAKLAHVHEKKLSLIQFESETKEKQEGSVLQRKLEANATLQGGALGTTAHANLQLLRNIVAKKLSTKSVWGVRRDCHGQHSSSVVLQTGKPQKGVGAKLYAAHTQMLQQVAKKCAQSVKGNFRPDELQTRYALMSEETKAKID